MSEYYEGLNQKLLAAIPADARRVLELGCANGRLGRRFKESHPDVSWWGVDCSEQATAIAAAHLDRVFTVDLDQCDLAELGNGFDVVVIGDLLEHLRQPERVLEALHDICAPAALIICCLPNMTHLSVLERMIAGDISYDAAGLLDRTHLRLYSPASAFKTLLDAGWLPHLHDEYRVEAPATEFSERIVDAAMALGIPRKTALCNLGRYQVILVCRKWPAPLFTPQTRPVQVSVIVPVNRGWQYDLNIARSPGLLEINAEIIAVQGATDAADAYRRGCAKATHGWRIMAHQDVYFPVGSGFAIAEQLGAIEHAGRCAWPVGFAGLEAHAGKPGIVRHVGMVIDRQSLFCHSASSEALSIDEFAVALHRDCEATIDATLGWHLWGTDLCLQTMRRSTRSSVAVIQVPLFHNSSNDYSLPAEFATSAQRLLEKYPGLDRIPTLCGEIARQAQAQVCF